LHSVYITDLAAFLPNDPVGNDEIEAVLGRVHGLPSRTRRIILRNNGIRSRHYALDPVTGRFTHTNAALVAEAVRRLNPYEGFTLSDIEVLACGTSSPDLLMPGHASMVHGELGGGPCEAVTTSGICMSGMAAMKYAYMSVGMGLSRNAVATGSELASSFLRAAWCGSGVKPENTETPEERPILAFDADFLRWMLSDGAGAAFLSDTPAEGRMSLRIEWIETASFAHELDTCMYAGGGLKDAEGEIKAWRAYDSAAEALDDGALLVKQDVKLLNEEIVRIAVDRALAAIARRRNLDVGDVRWFLPHYSSEFFRKPLMERMREQGFDIPEDRWFTNLPRKGNTGAASIYIIMEELFRSGKIQKGDRLLAFIPESGRFSMCYMLLTAV
jgi:3-oxoacyl-[acyl-carrier-protein] synthase-3